MRMMTEELWEKFQYLSFFFQNADFGPAHEDVMRAIEEAYTEETGKEVPEAYRV